MFLRPLSTGCQRSADTLSRGVCLVPVGGLIWLLSIPTRPFAAPFTERAAGQQACNSHTRRSACCELAQSAPLALDRCCKKSLPSPPMVWHKRSRLLGRSRRDVGPTRAVPSQPSSRATLRVPGVSSTCPTIFVKLFSATPSECFLPLFAFLRNNSAPMDFEC